MAGPSWQVQHLAQPGHVIGQRGQRELRRGDVVAAGLQPLDDAAPARALGPRAVDRERYSVGRSSRGIPSGRILWPSCGARPQPGYPQRDCTLRMPTVRSARRYREPRPPARRRGPAGASGFRPQVRRRYPEYDRAGGIPEAAEGDWPPPHPEGQRIIVVEFLSMEQAGSTLNAAEQRRQLLYGHSQAGDSRGRHLCLDQSFVHPPSATDSAPVRSCCRTPRGSDVWPARTPGIRAGPGAPR